ncbi:MAG: hypothetical protein QOF35_852, partial [Actinomycetota bacterium]|nr:hypothetical protein [Actinomycetota bacterium]
GHPTSAQPALQGTDIEQDTISG